MCVGGGVALLYASRELDKLQTANFDQKIGVQIIQNALKVLMYFPMCLIISVANFAPHLVPFFYLFSPKCEILVVPNCRPQCTQLPPMRELRGQLSLASFWNRII